MEQITISFWEHIGFAFLYFVLGVYLDRLLYPVQERIIIKEYCCQHGFENPKDYEEYVKGERDELH